MWHDRGTGCGQLLKTMGAQAMTSLGKWWCYPEEKGNSIIQILEGQEVSLIDRNRVKASGMVEAKPATTLQDQRGFNEGSKWR